MADEKITRRDFAQRTAGIAAGAALAGMAGGAQAAPDTAKILNFNPKMGYRRFGKTGVMMSEIGLGGHWKTPSGGRYWASFPNDNPPPEVQKNRNDVWVKCAEVGINYLDITTPGEAAIYGKAMKATGVKLHVGYSDHILCMRNPKNRTGEKLMREIDEGLRRLMIDRMFMWRPQADMGGRHTDAEIETVIETYHKAKKQGKVQFLGMSTHNRSWVQKVLEKYGDEYHGFVFMLGVHDAPKKDCVGLFKTAKAKDIGTVGLKPFHGNSYFRAAVRDAKKKGVEPDLNATAINGLKKLLEFPHLTCSIPGMTTTAEVENDVKASYTRDKKLSKAERDEVERIAAVSLCHLPHDYTWIRDQTFV